MKIIDCHVHLPMGQVQTLEQVEAVLLEAKNQNIAQLWDLGDVLRHGFHPDESQIKEINDLTIETVENFPDKIIGFCFLNPENDPAFLRKEIARCLDAGFAGVKLEASVNCRNERLTPIMEELEQRNGILFHHSWCKVTGNLGGESSPADIAFLAEKYASVKIVMPHLTGVGVRGILDIREHQNIYVDTSGGQPVNTLVEYAISQIGEDRILYGSDIPGRDFTCQIGRILGSNISEAAKRKLLCQNAENLLKGAIHV